MNLFYRRYHRFLSALPVLIALFGWAAAESGSAQTTMAAGIPAVASYSALDGEKYVEPTVCFEYQVPAAWVLADAPGLKFKVAFGERNGDFTSNIVVIDYPVLEKPISAAQMADSGVTVLSRMAPKFKLLGKREFRTNSGLKGFKITYQAEMVAGHRIQQSAYLFSESGANTKWYSITCSCLPQSAARLGPIFDQAMKTFDAKPAATPPVTSPLATSAAAVTAIPEIPGMKLVWHDEFNKDGAPDPENWDYEHGFVRNQEPQWYQPSNARVANGLLIIEARRERVPNPNFKEGSTDWKTNRPFAEFTSSSLTTKAKFGWTYGHFEMRARIDTRVSSWPAFWTVGKGRDWPHNGEIDIMEFYNHNLLANIAWGGKQKWSAIWNSKQKPVKSFTDPDWSTKFHVWTMDWDENKIVLSVDGEVMNSQDLTKTVNQDAEGANPFHAPQTIILNQAIGHGDPNETTFPIRFEVDYIRVYQKVP